MPMGFFTGTLVPTPKLPVPSGKVEVGPATWPAIRVGSWHRLMAGVPGETETGESLKFGNSLDQQKCKTRLRYIIKGFKYN